MNLLLMLGIASFGGLGAAARFLLDGLIRSRMLDSVMPWGTNLVNLSGSLLLGLLLGFGAGAVMPPAWVEVVGVGFCGGYTTFSAASFETVRLLQARRVGAALLNGIGMLVGSTLLAALGYVIGLIVSG